jgi:prevent-host-death family protein
MATETLSLTELRPRLSELIDRASDVFDRFVITRRGKVEAVLLSSDDYEGLLETLDILSDQELVRRRVQADEEIGRGETHRLEDVRREIQGAESA